MPSRSGQGAAGVRSHRPYFPRADWLWAPIVASPTLDAQSAGIVTNLASGTHVCDLVEYGVTLKPQSTITPSTTRYDIFFTNQTGNGGGNWGSDPFPSSMPIPAGTALPPGGDSHLSVIDGASNKSYSLWQASFSSPTWSASWGGWADLNGDGRENTSGSSTGAGLARYGAVITVAEIAAGRIDHALFFSTTIARSTTFRYPAVKTDGAAGSGTTTIMEGARVQLDPTIDLTAISGITSAELTIGRALQKYGAYCGDNGGAKMAFIFELASDNGGIGGTPGSVYNAAGLTFDYFGLTHIPWSSLRVLNSWNGI